MEWLKERSPGNYDLGPNLRFFLIRFPISKKWHDLKNDRGNLCFGWLETFVIGVSPAIGTSRISPNPFKMFMCSDVVGSSVVGNQVTDLLQEVNWIDIITLNRSTFNVFHCARTCGTLLRCKWHRPQVNWLNLVKETRFPPFTSNGHEGWKFNRIQTWPTRWRWLCSRTAESEG